MLAINTLLELASVLGAVEMAFRFRHRQNLLLHIRDLYDAALCLRILWILRHSHVQFSLAFAEGHVCCAITRRDLKYV
jgi:hypothetical protein